MQLRTFFRSHARAVAKAQALEQEYANWRREAEAVTESYRSWNRAPRLIHWKAYATYLAALDREERAACVYRHLVEQVQGL
jgi:hypothetical protein